MVCLNVEDFQPFVMAVNRVNHQQIHLIEQNTRVRKMNSVYPQTMP